MLGTLGCEGPISQGWEAARIAKPLTANIVKAYPFMNFVQRALVEI